MRNYPIISICLVIFFAACGFAACGGGAGKADANDANTATTGPNSPADKPKTDEVAVTVNGVDIAESDVEAKIKPQLEQMIQRIGKQMPPAFIEQYKTQLKQQALETMIVEQLLDEKAAADKIVVTEEEAIEQIKEMASQQQPPLSLEDFKSLIQAYGQSFDEVKQRIQRGLSYQKLIETQFAGKINFTEDDAKKYYSENKSKFETPEQVRASHILIKSDTADPNADPNQVKAKAKAKAEGLLKQIRDGADFATLAKANSNGPSAPKGGDLGFFGKGQMVPAFEKAAFELKIGQVSDVVQTQFGYHIIKAVDHKDAAVLPFEQAKDDILKTLTQNRQNELAEKFIESLKAQASIVYPAGKEPKTDK